MYTALFAHCLKFPIDFKCFNNMISQHGTPSSNHTMDDTNYKTYNAAILIELHEYTFYRRTQKTNKSIMFYIYSPIIQ